MSNKDLKIACRNHPICLIKNKEELLSKYKCQATDFLHKSFNERTKTLRFQALAEVTPSPQVLQVYRMLIALIGDTHLTDFFLTQIDWVSIDTFYMQGNGCGKNSSVCVKNYLLDHENIETKLRAIIRNPEKIVTKAKFVKMKNFLVKNEKIFKWLDDNKNGFVYNKLVYYLAQIIKLTIICLDHLVSIQGDLIEQEKKTKKIRIRKMRIDSYKKLLRRPNRLDSVKLLRRSRRNIRNKTVSKTTKIYYNNISNIYHGQFKFMEEVRNNRQKSMTPNYAFVEKNPFEVESDEADEELSKQLDPKNLIGFDKKSFNRQTCDFPHW